MRVIKLSKEEFSNKSEFYEYIHDALNSRMPKGKFRIPKGYISQDGIEINETILFVQESIVIGLGKTSSEVKINEDEYSEAYPKFFIFEQASFEQVNIDLTLIQGYLSKIGFEKNIVRTQGWPKIPEEYSNKIIEYIKTHD